MEGEWSEGNQRNRTFINQIGFTFMFVLLLPFTIHGEVNKRAKGKVYGVIFNCFTTRVSDVTTDPAWVVWR